MLHARKPVIGKFVYKRKFYDHFNFIRMVSTAGSCDQNFGYFFKYKFEIKIKFFG